jgi:hypothetical protein
MKEFSQRITSSVFDTGSLPAIKSEFQTPNLENLTPEEQRILLKAKIKSLLLGGGLLASGAAFGTIKFLDLMGVI